MHRAHRLRPCTLATNCLRRDHAQGHTRRYGERKGPDLRFASCRRSKGSGRRASRQKERWYRFDGGFRVRNGLRASPACWSEHGVDVGDWVLAKSLGHSSSDCEVAMFSPTSLVILIVPSRPPQLLPPFTQRVDLTTQTIDCFSSKRSCCTIRRYRRFDLRWCIPTASRNNLAHRLTTALTTRLLLSPRLQVTTARFKSRDTDATGGPLP